MQDNFNNFTNSKRDEYITAIFAFVLAILLHLLVFKIVPKKFNFEHTQKTQMAFEILPPIIKHKTPDFVEANPYGNELKPKENAPVSFKNQRVADEIPERNSTSNRPLVKGEDKRYKKIISGTSSNLDKLDPARITKVLERPLTEHTREEYQKTNVQKNNQPTTQNTKAQKINDIKTSVSQQQKDSLKQSSQQVKAQKISTYIAKPDKIDALTSQDSTNAILLPKIAQNKKDSSTKIQKQISNKSIEEPQKQLHPKKQVQEITQPLMPVDIPQPRMRPRLSMKIPAGPLMDNNRASSNNGVVSVDSKFSEFGAYQQRMIEAISRQWNLLGSKYDLTSEYGTFVLIEFSLNTEGELVNFRVVEASSANIGKGLCEQAILSTAPYGVWTQEMVNTLGQQPQIVRINFFYR